MGSNPIFFGKAYRLIARAGVTKRVDVHSRHLHNDVTAAAARENLNYTLHQYIFRHISTFLSILLLLVLPVMISLIVSLSLFFLFLVLVLLFTILRFLLP